MRDHKYNFKFRKKNVLQVHVHVPDLLTMSVESI